MRWKAPATHLVGTELLGYSNSDNPNWRMITMNDTTPMTGTKIRELRAVAARTDIARGVPMSAWWTETDYTDEISGETYPAIDVQMSVVEALLGHEHAGAPADDEAVIAALLDAGAPDWVCDAPGYLEPGSLGVEASWGVYRDLDEVSR